MTGRTPPEWIGKTPDEAVPPRVRVRVFERAAGKCAGCTRKLTARDKWQADHVLAVINGGANRERNLQLLCSWCHKLKTAEDVAEKALVYRKKSKHLGADRKRSSFATSRDGRLKQKIGGQVVDRETGMPVGRRGS